MTPARTNPRAERYRSVDIHHLRRLGLFDRSHLLLKWTDGTRAEVSTIDSYLAFRFLQGQKEMIVRVPFSTVDTPFGGRRRWLACPSCLRRCARLWFVLGGMQCRQCLQPSYATQSMNRTDRLAAKARKIESQLGPDLSRPKGMHRKRYAKMIYTHQVADQGALSGYLQQAEAYAERSRTTRI